jgi:hypothetical protein
MNKKKVMFIIPHLGIGGAERVVANLCNGLADYERIVLIFENIIKHNVDAQIISINSPATQNLSFIPIKGILKDEKNSYC